MVVIKPIVGTIELWTIVQTVACTVGQSIVGCRRCSISIRVVEAKSVETRIEGRAQVGIASFGTIVGQS